MMRDIDRNNMNAKKIGEKYETKTDIKRKETKRDKERQRETKKLRSIDRMTELKQCISQASV